MTHSNNSTVSKRNFQKDDYERLVKDNQNLKERRAFPEKLEELDRYRNQVLEYSKCITALRQAGLVSLPVFEIRDIFLQFPLSGCE